MTLAKLLELIGDKDCDHLNSLFRTIFPDDCPLVVQDQEGKCYSITGIEAVGCKSPTVAILFDTTKPEVK